jgi:hypothetical protein
MTPALISCPDCAAPMQVEPRTLGLACSACGLFVEGTEHCGALLLCTIAAIDRSFEGPPDGPDEGPRHAA